MVKRILNFLVVTDINPLDLTLLELRLEQLIHPPYQGLIIQNNNFPSYLGKVVVIAPPHQGQK